MAMDLGQPAAAMCKIFGQARASEKSLSLSLCLSVSLSLSLSLSLQVGSRVRLHSLTGRLAALNDALATVTQVNQSLCIQSIYYSCTSRVTVTQVNPH